MSVTKQHLLEQAAAFKKKVESGKLKGAQLKKARTAMYNYARRAKNHGGVKPAVKAKVTKGQNHLANPKQGILPGLLSQLNPVRIEEMVADRAFKRIDQLIEAAIERVFNQKVS